MRQQYFRIRRESNSFVIIAATLVAIASLLFALLAPERAGAAQRGNTKIDKYMQANWDEEIARGIPYPARTEPKVLRGSWHDMGKQYGKAYGTYVRIVYDTYYGRFLTSGLDPNKLGAVLDKYTNETKKFSPEMVEFIRGIGQGAAKDLNNADYPVPLTNAQKVMFVNCLFEVAIPPAWPHVAELMNEELSQAAASKAKAEFEPFASHGWTAWGDMTKGYSGIMGGTRDQPWMPTLYNVSYVAIPSDKKAAVTWGNTIAGHVASSSQVNEHGVGLGNTIVSQKDQYFGVPALIATAHISFFAKSAREAADMLTVGTKQYRHKTGNKTLKTTVGFFQVFADAKKGYTVERTGRHYAVRTAGTQGEQRDYTVLANHAVAGYSFDENATFTGKPMEAWTQTSSPTSSTWSRYWALFHEFDKLKRPLTVEYAKEKIATMKHTYTSNGQKVTEINGVPAWRAGHTPERWLIPNPADPNSFPTGGNNMYFVADLKKKDVYWAQGIPSHWKGAWERVSLDDRHWKKY